MSETQSPHLSEQAIEEYRRVGYITGERILDGPELISTVGQIDQFLQSLKPGHSTERLLNLHVEHSMFLDLALHPNVLLRVRSLLGEDLALFNSRLMVKEPGVGRPVAWHQDVKYFPLEPPEVVTCWLALDPVGTDNSPLLAAPGRHRQGVFPHFKIDQAVGVFDEEIDPERVDLSTFERLTLDAGCAVLMEGHVPHASEANVSGQRRAAFIARYISTKTALNRGVRELYGADYPLWWIDGTHGVNNYANI